MIDFLALLKVFPIFAVALVSPGPDFMIVSSLALKRGRKAGIEAAAGIASGVLFYVVLSLEGLAAIFDQFLWLAIAIKILGGLYLVYLGIQLWRASATAGQTVQKTAAVPPVKKNAYLAGFLTNLTNPKAIAFFTSVFALTITSATSMETRAAMSFMMMAMTFIWFAFVTFGLTNTAIRTRYNCARKAIDRIAGSVMILFGAKLISSAAD